LLGTIQESLQTWTAIRYIHIGALSAGLALAHRQFGRRSLVLTTLIGSFFTTTALLSIYWWQVFPFKYDIHSKEMENFNMKNELFFVASFTVLAAILYSQRQCFHRAVFHCLMASMIVRIAHCLIDAMLVKADLGPLNTVVLFLKLISSAIELNAAGLTRLLRPYEQLQNRVSEQRRALATEKLFAEWIVDQVAVLMVFLDLDGRIIHYNKCAADTLRRKNPEFGNEHFETIAPEYKVLIQNFKDMKTMENVRFTSNRDDLSIEWTASILSTLTYREKATNEYASDVPEKVVLCIGQDVTDSVNREKLLLQAKSDAEKLSVMKDAFVQNVSHELRTPLNCILGVTSLLLQTPLSHQQKEMTDMIFKSSNSLISVINDLLDFSKLQYGKVKLEPTWVDIRKILEDLLISVSVLYQTTGSLEFGYRIEKDCPKMLFLDEKRLKQILMNLLSNAIKFTKKGQIMIHLRRGSPTTLCWDSVEFRVSDTGQGIKSEDIPKLFTRFEILEYSPAKQVGTGLGLPISKQLVEIMGGLMGAESEYGVGSTFWFQIPVSDPNMDDISHVRETPPIPVTNPKETPHKVLLFLDNEVILGHVIDTLKEDYNLDIEPRPTLDQLNIALKMYTECSIEEFRSISVVAEVDHLELLDLHSLSNMKGKGINLHVIAVAIDFADLLNRDFSNYPFRVDVVQKPLRITSLVQLLLNNNHQGESTIVGVNFKLAEAVLLTDVQEKMHNSKVLVVEDNPVNRKVLSMMLDRSGFMYEMVENGLQAVEEFKKNKYFAILMDLQMPVMDGYAATREIRHLESAQKLPRTPIIALTANAMESDRQKCIHEGMDDFISKPIQLDSLKHKLQHALVP